MIVSIDSTALKNILITKGTCVARTTQISATTDRIKSG